MISILKAQLGICLAAFFEELRLNNQTIKTIYERRKIITKIFQNSIDKSERQC